MNSPYFYLGQSAEDDEELFTLQLIYEHTGSMPDRCIEDDGDITLYPKL